MLPKTLGQRIRELRLKKGITQIEFAQGVCTPSMVSQVESDRARPSYKILTAFAEKLDTSLESLLANVNMNLEFISQQKMAKSMVAAKQYEAAIPLLKDLLLAPRSIIPSTEVLLLLSECFLYTGAMENAEETLDKLRVQFISEDNHHMLSIVLNYYGLLEMEKKQYEVAVFHFENALDELTKDEVYDQIVAAGLYLNLGRLREKQGKLKQAIEFYQKAQDIYRSTETTEQMAMAFLDMARSYQRIYHLEMSVTYSERAHTLFRAVNDIYMGVKAQMINAVAEGQLGHEEESIRVLETVIKKFQQMRKNEDVGITYVELAKLQLALDDHQSAEESCGIARSLLPELHLYQAWVHRLQGEIEVKRGNHTEAIRRLGMAGDCFKLLGEIGEWAETMAVLSKLKIEEKDLYGALDIMECVRVTTRNALQDRGIVL